MRTRFWTLGLVVGLLVPATAGLWAGTARAASWLGVYSQDITPELREGLGYNGNGVLIRSVVSASPADRAGLERGDVIVKVGMRDIRTPSELAEAVRANAAGRRVAVEIVRDGRRRVVEATLEERPEDSGEAPRAEAEDRWEQRVPAPRGPKAPDTPAPMDDLHELDGLDLDLPDLGHLPGLMGRGRLGVRVESLNPDLASYFGGRDVRGALVLDVTDDSPADRAGIRAGDVITRVNATGVTGADDLVKAVRDSDADATIALIRHGERETIEVRLGERPEPRVLRLRTGPEGFRWRTRDGERVREWNWTPDRGGERRRIVIRGDEKPGEADPDLRRELQELREELRRLREELRER
jgi:membrane-associated protease RseP (regulator of RpoE activity)